jgi:hypothetical protein
VTNSQLKTQIILGAAAAGAGAASMIWLATGVAAASPDLSGKTFAQAQASLELAGYSAVVGSVIGDKTAQNDCTVIGQQDLTGGFPSSWLTSQTINGVFLGGDQPTLYPGPGFGNVPTTGQVIVTLACYRVDDAGPARPTGSGDINTKKANTGA